MMFSNKNNALSVPVLNSWLTSQSVMEMLVHPSFYRDRRYEYIVGTKKWGESLRFNLCESEEFNYKIKTALGKEYSEKIPFGSNKIWVEFTSKDNERKAAWYFKEQLIAFENFYKSLNV